MSPSRTSSSCESIAPFGAAAVPEVYMMIAQSRTRTPSRRAARRSSSTRAAAVSNSVEPIAQDAAAGPELHSPTRDAGLGMREHHHLLGSVDCRTIPAPFSTLAAGQDEISLGFSQPVSAPQESTSRPVYRASPRERKVPRCFRPTCGVRRSPAKPSGAPGPWRRSSISTALRSCRPFASFGSPDHLQRIRVRRE